MTEASRSTVQAILPERRTAMAFALMFAVLAIGWRIPLPGLDLGSVKPVYGEVPATLSIFALGLVPLFTILGYAEIANWPFHS